MAITFDLHRVRGHIATPVLPGAVIDSLDGPDRLHPVTDRRFTGSNYVTLIPWFGKLFRSAAQKPFRELPDLVVGPDYFREAQDSGIVRLLFMPFRRRQGETAGSSGPQTTVWKK